MHNTNVRTNAKASFPPITTQIIQCAVLNTAKHNSTGFPGPEMVLNSSPICIKHPSNFFFYFSFIFLVNNVLRRNCAVLIEAQITCHVTINTGILDFVEQNSTNPKYVKFSNTSNADVLLDMLTAVNKRDCS